MKKRVKATYKPVVTMWETYGSGMAEVAAKVAAAMGSETHQGAFTSEALEALEANMDSSDAEAEQNSGLNRVLRLIADGTPTATGLARRRTVTMEQRDHEELVAANNTFVRAAAEKGGVIIGRNGTVILKDRPNTLHVKLDGPADMRVARASEVFRLSAAQATKRQLHEDEFRSQTSITLYGWDPRRNDHYDLVLNTLLLGIDTSATIILAAAEVKAAGLAGPPQRR